MTELAMLMKTIPMGTIVTAWMSLQEDIVNTMHYVKMGVDVKMGLHVEQIKTRPSYDAIVCLGILEIDAKQVLFTMTQVNCCHIFLIGNTIQNKLILFEISETDITRPKFDGNGYLSFPISATKSIRHLTSFSLEIKTLATDGMILWIGEVIDLYRKK